jgi:hypothetical protein
LITPKFQESDLQKIVIAKRMGDSQY